MNLAFKYTPSFTAADTYKHQDRYQFLTALDIRTESLTPWTYKILSNIDTFPLPQRGETFRIRTQQQINLLAILLKILDHHQTLDSVLIASYTLNKEAFAVLEELVRTKKIKSLSLFLAQSYSYRDRDYFYTLQETMKRLHRDYDVHLVFAWLHLKITLIRCGEDYYQYEGSMNYSTNNMAEQIVFENRKETYEYDLTFFQQTIMGQTLKALHVIC